jgi:hypothetical protein
VRSTLNRVVAERYFPVRLRVAVPPGGFGRQLTAMQTWLDQHVGHESYWMGGDTGPGRPDAVSAFFLDVAAAHSFVDQFTCGMAVIADPDPTRGPPAMNGASAAFDSVKQ